MTGNENRKIINIVVYFSRNFSCKVSGW